MFVKIAHNYNQQKQTSSSHRNASSTLTYTKKIHQKVDFCVGVDGFEPPTLCL